MIKSLPKRIRRNLVPAADVAAQICDELKDEYGQVPFMTAVCQAMSRHAEVPITAADFQWDKIDDHLQFLVTVVDDDGATVAEGRDLAPLQQRVGTSHSAAGTQAVDTSTRVGRESRRRVSTSTIYLAR